MNFIGASEGYYFDDKIRCSSVEIGGTEVIKPDGKIPAAQVDGLADAVATVPSGAVNWFAGATAPDGWLECDGSLVSRTTYANLFAAIGTVYGAGDGSTTFSLPDLRGEFIRGWDNGRGIDSGRNLGSEQDDAVGPHNHDLPFGGGAGAGRNGNAMLTNNVGPAFTGSTGSSETRPRNIAMMGIIKI